tara:strand:- start:5692 stop:6678 length:987 start_codon:yes stop_codon:yes gene_type:complete
MKLISSYKSFNVARSSIILFSITLAMFLFSFFFAPFYWYGDQVGYNNAYNAVRGSSLVLGYLDYQQHITGEPIHYFIVWVTSNLGLEKNLVMAFGNAILAYLIMRVFINLRVSLFVAIIIIFTNYYMLGLYFAAERLKFGFIFFFLALLYLNKPKLSIAFAITSIFTHAQQLLIYVSVLFSTVTTNIIYSLKTAKLSTKNIFFIFAMVPVLLFFYEVGGPYIIQKVITYNERSTGSLVSLWKALLFLLLTLLYTPSRLQVLCIFSVLLFAALVVGPERVNMITYFVFMYYALQYKNGINVGVILTSSYFGLKSVQFILSVIDNGHGFG